VISDATGWLGGSIERLTAHSRQPLYRNAYALIASSGLTSALGLAYWILAARIYPADTVGFNAAAISAMMFLAGLAQLNLISVLVRFVPESGRLARRLILAAYGISIVIALVASLAFLTGFRLWTPALAGLSSSAWLVVWFVASTMAWCVFVLEDSAMTGLRRATWVPVSNGMFALAKMALLVVLAGFAPTYGIFGSWTLALAVSLIFTNALIFGRLIPRFLASAAGNSRGLPVRSIARYLSADYIASIFWLTCTTLLPVIVTSVVGVRMNAYFFLAWQIGYSLHILSISTGSSFIVEAVIFRDELAEYSRRVFRHNLRITVPVATAVALVAPYLMQVFGRAYAAEGTNLLRFLALAAVPFSIVSLAISVARVQRRMRRVVSVLAAMCVAVLLLTEVLLRTMGLSGVGIAWLAVQLLLAAIVLPTQLMPLWATGVERTDRASALLNQLRKARALWRHTLFGIFFNRAPLELLTQIEAIEGHEAPRLWKIKRVVSVTPDIAVLTLGARDGRAELATLKVARSKPGAASIRRSVDVLLGLRSDRRLASLHGIIPGILGHGVVGGRAYVVEEALAGKDGRTAIADVARRQRVFEEAIRAIRILHDQTATSVLVDDELATRWIDQPARIIARLAHNHRGVALQLAALERVRLDLRRDLIGSRTTVSWVHGDFVPGNILVAPDSDGVVGIIDWDQAVPDDLPSLDVMQFLLAARIAATGCELGDLVSGLLGGSTLSDQEAELLRGAQSGPVSRQLSVRQLVLLCWLRHLASNLGKSRLYGHHRWWVRRNVEQVLRTLRGEAAGTMHPAPQLRAVRSDMSNGNRVSDGAKGEDEAAARTIPILLYHSVSANPSQAIGPFAVSPERFAQHLDLVADGHVALTVADLVARLDIGAPIPAGAVVITFDDGFADNLEAAAPLLKDRGLTASIYITTGYVDGSGSGEVPGRMLSWSGVEELDAAGFEIGAHGHRHSPLDVMSPAEVAKDISMSKTLIQERLGHGLFGFAYPHGYRSSSVRQAVRRAGFECACGVRNALSHPLDDRWSLARLTVLATTPTELFAAWLRGESAPIARTRDAVQTVAWRSLRRLAVTSRGSRR